MFYEIKEVRWSGEPSEEHNKNFEGNKDKEMWPFSQGRTKEKGKVNKRTHGEKKKKWLIMR